MRPLPQSPLVSQTFPSQLRARYFEDVVIVEEEDVVEKEEEMRGYFAVVARIHIYTYIYI